MCKIFFFLFVFTLILMINCEKCTNNIEINIPEYYLISMCHRSKMGILASINLKTVEECKNFAIKRRAMAFNFKSKTKFKNQLKSNNTDNLKSCIILSCPEMENSTSIIKDYNYDYYSIFINPIPPVNATCIENIGIFVYHLFKLNYTDAKKLCKSLGADLADVTTESRTTELSKYISAISGSTRINKIFYIGMDDIETEGEFIKANGASIKCSTYRAWAPGDPKNYRKTQNCVVLDSNKLWRVVDCDKKYPFICEIFPDGHYSYYDDYEFIDCEEHYTF